jgi:hypothetical protein
VIRLPSWQSPYLYRIGVATDLLQWVTLNSNLIGTFLSPVFGSIVANLSLSTSSILSSGLMWMIADCVASSRKYLLVVWSFKETASKFRLAFSERPLLFLFWVAFYHQEKQQQKD